MNPQSLTSLEWFHFLEHYSAHCASAPAKHAALKLEPATDQSEAENRLQLTFEGSRLLEEHSYPYLSGLETLTSIIERLRKESVLDGKELRYLAKLAAIAFELKTNLLAEANLAPLLSAKAGMIPDLSKVVKPIHHAIDEEGKVLDSASPALKSLRDQERRLHSEAREKVEAVLQQAFRAGYLQEKFYDFRGGKYLIPVKAEFRNKVPGFVVENSSTNATVFMEPSAVRDCNDQIKQIQLQIEEEVYRILFELSTQLFPHAESFALSYETSIAIDLCLARASFAMAYEKIRGVSRPEFADSFELEELYHPLLGFVLRPEKIIRNTLRLGPEKRILIISGPNTGGKTVLLKAVGLCSLMARSGFFLPCAGRARLPFFLDVLSQIGDSQNLELSLSSFSGSIVQLNEILASSGPGSLVLVDEILHATDPDEATALGRAILETLQDKGAFAIVTTHLNGLKVAGSTDFENASMEFDTETMSPTYRLRMGVPGSSRSLEIAQKLGLPEKIVLSAKNYLSQDKVHAQDTLDLLEKREKELQATKNELDLSIEQAEKEKSKWKFLSEELASAKTKFREEAMEKIRNQQKEALASLDQIVSKYKERLARVEEKHESTVEAQQDQAKIKQQFQEVETVLEKSVPLTKIKSEEIQSSLPLKKNSTVFVKSMQSEAILLSDPENRAKPAEVQIGIMRLKVPWDQLELKNKTSFVNQRNPYRAQEEVDCPHELQLIGKTVDAAMDLTEAFLDRASRSGRASVRIVHGHGSGALRKAIRDFLSTCSYEMKFRPGSKQEGGEGCTIVEFI